MRLQRLEIQTFAKRENQRHRSVLKRLRRFGTGHVGDVEAGEALVLAGDLRAQLVPQLVGNLEEDFHHGGVELRSGAAQNLFARRVEAARLAVGTVAGDRVQGVGQGKDARADGNLIAAQAAGIARSRRSAPDARRRSRPPRPGRESCAACGSRASSARA